MADAKKAFERYSTANSQKAGAVDGVAVRADASRAARAVGAARRSDFDYGDCMDFTEFFRIRHPQAQALAYKIPCCIAWYGVLALQG